MYTSSVCDSREFLHEWTSLRVVLRVVSGQRNGRVHSRSLLRGGGSHFESTFAPSAAAIVNVNWRVPWKAKIGRFFVSCARPRRRLFSVRHDSSARRKRRGASPQGVCVPCVYALTHALARARIANTASYVCICTCVLSYGAAQPELLLSRGNADRRNSDTRGATRSTGSSSAA